MSRSIGTARLVLAGLLSSVVASVGFGEPVRQMAQAAAQAVPRDQPGAIAPLGPNAHPAADAANGVESGAAPRSAGDLSAQMGGEPRLQVRTQDGVEYVSGGVSREEEDAITSMGRRFNLKLTLAQANGEYMGGAHIRIDNPGNHNVVDTQSEGPLFFARLPAGTYTIHVSGEGQQFTKVAQITGAGQQQLSFIWPAEGRREAGDSPAD